MNIIIYNFDDAPINELSVFLEKVNASVYFALSLSEVGKLLATNQIEVAILKILDDSEIAKLKTMIISNPQTEFYISNTSDAKVEYSSEPRIHLLPTNIQLTQIANQIK